jgi:enediyne biosynthesis protein E4
MEVRSHNRAMAALVLGIGVLLGLNAMFGSPQDKPLSSPIQFTDITTAAGIKFVHFKGNDGISINREEFGPGVCVADFDGDGWQDIYFVNGRDLYNRGISVRNALYRNNGDGTFTDVTERAGVPGTGYGLGCVWGDYDNDGWPDLFVTQ